MLIYTYNLRIGYRIRNGVNSHFLFEISVSPIPPCVVKNMKKIITYSAVAVAILALSAGSTYAGLFDWVGSSETLEAFAGASVYIGDALSIDQMFLAPNSKDLITFQGNSIIEQSSPVKTGAKRQTARRTYVVSISAYSSTPDQTDSTPFITAANTYVRDGIVAANFLPFGTAIKIPAVFGNKIFIVEDRMAKRFSQHVDIWFPDRQSALNFGRRTLTIEVLSS